MTKQFRYSKIQNTKRFKRISQESSTLGKFVTKALIFRNSHSHMFFKRGVHKNLAILEPLFNKLSCRPSFAGFQDNCPRGKLPHNPNCNPNWEAIFLGSNYRDTLLQNTQRGFSRQQIFLSGESSIYCLQSHQFLFGTL